MTGFKAFRRKGGDIQAQQITTNMQIDGQDLVPGDYLVNDNGVLKGAVKAEFEEAFEPVKKNYNKPKAKKEGEKAATPATA